MLEPAIPHNEYQRLETLRSLDILDTPAEARFDRLTRMARRIFDVPIALVSLVDSERQWFKSCMGLPVLETTRDISFCGHTILGDDIFLIHDTAQDERFADNPLVTGEPYIRFYAGAPLRAQDGSKLGTLCIIDQKPRYLTVDDVETLRDLAEMVEGELAALQLATTDELTGIPNRRGLLMLAQNSISICRRNRIPASLVYCDLNGFKAINDTLGHAEGDKALKAFASCLSSSFRDTDLVARLGGDEFVVLLTNASATEAALVLEGFRTQLEIHNRKAQKGYNLCFSGGVVEFDPDEHWSIEGWLEQADSKMYLAKNEERVQVSEARSRATLHDFQGDWR